MKNKCISTWLLLYSSAAVGSNTVCPHNQHTRVTGDIQILYEELGSLRRRGIWRSGRGKVFGFLHFHYPVFSSQYVFDKSWKSVSGEHLEDLDGMKFSFVPYGQQLGDSCQQPCLFSTVHCAQNPSVKTQARDMSRGEPKQQYCMLVCVRNLSSL